MGGCIHLLLLFHVAGLLLRLIHFVLALKASNRLSMGSKGVCGGSLWTGSQGSDARERLRDVSRTIRTEVNVRNYSLVAVVSRNERSVFERLTCVITICP